MGTPLAIQPCGVNFCLEALEREHPKLVGFIFTLLLRMKRNNLSQNIPNVLWLLPPHPCFSRSCMLQADSEKLRQAWIQAVQASIASAYRESPDSYYIEVRENPWKNPEFPVPFFT